MHRIARLVVLFCLLAGLSGAWAQPLPAPVQQALARAGIDATAIGAVVQEVGAPRSLLEANADQPFAPASLMKLVTTAAALDLLGPAWTWRTEALSNAALSGDVLNGNLVIRGSGDPRLVEENFWQFLRQLRARGVREIRGALVLDRSYFQADPSDPAAFDGDPARPYNALPDALLLNFKALTLRFAPDEAAGMVRVNSQPALEGWPLAAPLLADGACGDWRAGLRLTGSPRGLAFDGTYPASCGERSLSLHAWQLPPDRYFEAVFRAMWRELGGVFKGEVVSGMTPPDARLLAQWQSPALAEVIRDVNKYSNNVMARHLFLTIGAQSMGVPGEVGKGAQAVQTWLGAKGIATPGFVIENGSGLSRNARIAPRSLAQVLAFAWQSPLMPEYLASLPLSGLDGTMRNRLRNAPGMAHIKTGTLEGVRGVAGYVQAASGRRYVVVGMVNHPAAAAAGGALDALLQWVLEKG